MATINFSPFSNEDVVERINKDLLASINQDAQNATKEDNEELKKAAINFISKIRTIEKQFKKLLNKTEVSYKTYQETQRLRMSKGRDLEQYFFLTRLAGKQFSEVRHLVYQNRHIYDQILTEADIFRQTVFKVLGRTLQLFVVVDNGDIIRHEIGGGVWTSAFDSSGYFQGTLRSKTKALAGQNILNNLDKYGNVLGKTVEQQKKNFQNLQQVYQQARYRRTTFGKDSQRVMWLTKGLTDKKWGVAKIYTLGSLSEAYAAAVFSKDNRKIISQIDLEKKLHKFFTLFGWQPDNTPGSFIEDINFEDKDGNQYSASIKALGAETGTLAQLVYTAQELIKAKNFSTQKLVDIRKELTTKVTPSIKLSLEDALDQTEEEIYNYLKQIKPN